MIPTSPKISVKVASKVPANADAIVVLLHKQADDQHPEMLRIPPELRATIRELRDAGAVTGRSNELTTQVLNGKPAKRLMVIGLGNIAVFSCECLREGSAVAARAAKKQMLRRVTILVPPLPEQMPGRPGASPAGAGVDVGPGALVSGFLLAHFEWTEYRGKVTSARHATERIELTLVVPSDDLKRSQDSADRAFTISEAQNLARTISFKPPNEINPVSLAELVQQIAKETNLSCRILDEKQMKRLGMGGILAVGAGANRTPPRLIVLEHPAATHKKQAPLLLVGKGITFDTGGLSIKSSSAMFGMVFDKCGAMTVLGTMVALAKLKSSAHVVGILACAENHISETSYRPNDLLRMYNGVTVEVTNTDAEGRLVLGDALAWGVDEYKPSAVVDLATLTYGVGVALGQIWAGLMSNSDALVAEITRSADSAGEKVWRLPLSGEVNDMLKSDVADIINDGSKYGTALQGGAFLSHFIPEDGKTPWGHLDIANVADTDRELPYYGKGATGWGVRTLVEWITSRSGSHLKGKRA